MGRLPDYEIIPHKRNPKKARISYWVDLPQPFHYGSVQLWGWNPPMDSIVRSYMRFSELKTGKAIRCECPQSGAGNACPIG